jgi:hypothetical protein
MFERFISDPKDDFPPYDPDTDWCNDGDLEGGPLVNYCCYVHDKCYDKRQGRSRCDKEFFDCIYHAGPGLGSRAWIYYTVVRLGGWWNYYIPIFFG